MIRLATVADLDLLVPLFDAYRQFYKQPSDLSAARAYLQARLERHEATVFLDSQGLGFALCYSTFSSVALKPLVILNDLYTVPQARGRGVGTALLRQCRVFAADSGAAILRLRTAHDNHTAQRVYERFGFTKDGVYWTYDLLV
jgi:ribosomal protein S18 acetylase RimI-like enzyme